MVGGDWSKQLRSDDEHVVINFSLSRPSSLRNKPGNMPEKSSEMEIYCGIFCKIFYIRIFRRKTHRDMYFWPMPMKSNCNCNVTRIRMAWMHFMRYRASGPSWARLWTAPEWRNGIGSWIYVLQRIYIETAALREKTGLFMCKVQFLCEMHFCDRFFY